MSRRCCRPSQLNTIAGKPSRRKSGLLSRWNERDQSAAQTFPAYWTWSGNNLCNHFTFFANRRYLLLCFYHLPALAGHHIVHAICRWNSLHTGFQFGNLPGAGNLRQRLVLVALCLAFTFPCSPVAGHSFQCRVMVRSCLLLASLFSALIFFARAFWYCWFLVSSWVKDTNPALSYIAFCGYIVWCRWWNHYWLTASALSACTFNSSCLSLFVSWFSFSGRPLLMACIWIPVTSTCFYINSTDCCLPASCS